MEQPQKPSPAWALVAVQCGRSVEVVPILETTIPTAVACGWTVIARDSDMQPRRDVSVQSNPRRRVDDRYDDNGASDPDE